MKKVIVTGPTGFIGRRVVPLLAKKYKKKELLFLVRNKDGVLKKAGRNIIKNLGLQMKYVDLNTRYGLDNLSKKPDTIIHLAANTNTADPDHRVNNLGTENLINSFGKLNSKTHFIYISTTAFMSGRKDCSRPFNESSKPSPTNGYGRTKLEAEKLLIEKCKKDKFCLTILRLPTVYGRGMRKDSFFNFLKKYVKGDSIISKINWPGLTSFVHVDDVAKAIVQSIKHPPGPGKYGIYILQADAYTLRQIFHLASFFYHKDFKPIDLPSFIWDIAKVLRKYVYIMEQILPTNIYNYFWRVSIVVDDVIFTKSNRIKKIIPTWKPKKLKNNLNQVFK